MLTTETIDPPVEPAQGWSGARKTIVRDGRKRVGGVVHMADGTFEAWAGGRHVGSYETVDTAVASLVAGSTDEWL